MSDDYSFVATGSLKLKKDSKTGLNDRDKKKKKKKQKQKQATDLLQKVKDHVAAAETDTDSNSQGIPTETVKQDQLQQHQENSWMTEAEKKFLAQQEKRQLARVMAKASKTHKQRVEEFNSNLEKLSEHYDIPKVSWTK